MKNEKKRGIRQRGNQNGMLLVSIVALVLLISFLLQGHSLRQRRDYYNSRMASLEEQIEQEQNRTREIKEEQEYRKTDEYIESMAREKLGLVKENEILFKEVE